VVPSLLKLNEHELFGTVVAHAMTKLLRVFAQAKGLRSTGPDTSHRPFQQMLWR